MDIKEFVTMTIEQIVAGVSAAHSAAQNHDATVNPRNIRGAAGRAQDDSLGYVNCGTGIKAYTRRVTIVSFDLQVEVRESKSKGIQGGLRVVSGELSKGAEHTQLSRVQFTVPLALPSAFISNAPPIDDEPGAE